MPICTGYHSHPIHCIYSTALYSLSSTLALLSYGGGLNYCINKSSLQTQKNETQNTVCIFLAIRQVKFLEASKKLGKTDYTKKIINKEDITHKINFPTQNIRASQTEH